MPALPTWGRTQRRKQSQHRRCRRRPNSSPSPKIACRPPLPEADADQDPRPSPKKRQGIIIKPSIRTTPKNPAKPPAPPAPSRALNPAEAQAHLELVVTGADLRRSKAEADTATAIRIRRLYAAHAGPNSEPSTSQDFEPEFFDPRTSPADGLLLCRCRNPDPLIPDVGYDGRGCNVWHHRVYNACAAEKLQEVEVYVSDVCAVCASGVVGGGQGGDAGGGGALRWVACCGWKGMMQDRVVEVVVKRSERGVYDMLGWVWFLRCPGSE
ncbi:hypothetical protein LTR49_027320 [Elasticomyces elasticus]|nr:hypothetical protein LTR49_027320 [Elasticomyces elasticus]